MALPLLVIVADVLGVMGGFIVATLKLGFGPHAYSANHPRYPDRRDDIVAGLAKAGVFGFLDRVDGVLPRLPAASGGAQGVGAATTSAVVSASILILAFDYVLTELFFAR